MEEGTATTSHNRAARELPRLRRGAYGFLRGLAAYAWEHRDEWGRWEITLPPDVAALPERQRFRVHARQEARRLACAQLYDLDSEISRQAVDLAAAAGEELDEQAAALAGTLRATTTAEISLPAASGFVRWRGGIGCNGLGAPVVACHWGPGPGGGQWLAWWADSQAMASGWEAQARADGQQIDASFVPQIFGPLWYDHQDLLRPGDAGTRDDSIPEPEPAADASPAGAGTGTPGLVLLRTTLATWRLLTCPGADIQLRVVPVPTAEQEADRADGLRSRRVTIATAVTCLP